MQTLRLVTKPRRTKRSKQQMRDAYVHDLSLSIQTVLNRLEAMYVKDATAYVGADFTSLSALSNCVSRKETFRSASPIEFWSDPDDPEDKGTAHYVYGDEGVKLLAVPRRKGTAGRPPSTTQPVTRKSFKLLLSHVKLRASAAAKALRLELVRRFPSPKLLSALSIVYPQYYADFAEADFNDHIEALCGFYGSGREVDGATMPALVDPELLRAQAPFFQQYAVEVAQRIKANLDGLPQITQFWRRLAASPSFGPRISEFMKLAKIAIVMVGGSIEDERVFSTMNFVKDKLRNCLSELELCVRLKSQRLFTLDTFPSD